MKLKSTKENLVKNIRYWRGNLERGLSGAKSEDGKRLRELVADLVLIEVMLRKTPIEYVELDYTFPDIAGPKPKGANLWLPPSRRQ